ncbi:hypothetical protein ACFPC0_10890 [Streptomyces andamanensis]|uniref:Uncharacterized protein n=1 Tax=Streptomyces andamanensis TaxID=1565035 RepID=A0ABV8TCK6_9ACTN
MALTHPRPERGPHPRRTSTPRSDRYQCPRCERWIGEHFKTGTLAGHQAPDGDPYTLCNGSWHPLKGLPGTNTPTGLPALYTAPYTQPPLFT